jgi:hypothetical protein
MNLVISFTGKNEANSLLKFYLDNPGNDLTSEQKITLIREGIYNGEQEANKAKGKEIICLMGNPGSGISTMANYLLGCTLEKKSPQDLGLIDLQKVVVVKPKSEGGILDEVMPIRHRTKKLLPSYIPQLASDEQGRIYCDCPGFSTHRSFELNIASAINIKNILISAESIKILLMISFDSLMADKARGLAKLIKISVELLGSTQNLIKHKNSILFCITKVPKGSILFGGKTFQEPIKELHDWMLDSISKDKDEKAVLQCLTERLFIYDPLDQPLKFKGSWKKIDILKEIDSLEPIKKIADLFKTVLSAEEEHGLYSICEDIGTKIKKTLKKKELVEEDFKIAALFQDSLNKLEILNHLRISRLIQDVRSIIKDQFEKMVLEFDRCFLEDNLEGIKKAQSHLQKIQQALQHFDRDVKQTVYQMLEDSSNRTNKNLSSATQLMKAHTVKHQKINWQMQDLILATNNEVEKMGDRLSKNLQEFSVQGGQLYKSLEGLMEQIKKEFQNQLKPERIHLVWSLFRLAKNSLELIKDSSSQYLTLEKKASELGFKNFQGTLEIALYARKLEIDHVKDQLEILIKQEDHTLALNLQSHTQKLKEESQKFNQLLQIKELESQKNDTQIKQELAFIEQDFVEIEERGKLFAKKQTLENQHQKKLCLLEIKGLKEMHRMDVEARCKLAEFLSQYPS